MPFQQLGFFLIYMWEHFICSWQWSWNFCAKNSWPYFLICILLFSHGSLGVSQLRGVWLLMQTRSSTDLISVQITLFQIIRSFQNHMSAGIIYKASSEPGRFPRRSPRTVIFQRSWQRTQCGTNWCSGLMKSQDTASKGGDSVHPALSCFTLGFLSTQSTQTNPQRDDSLAYAVF